ncbi:NADPH-flavin oxidoreductase [Xylariales sp. PMI_506]|nr:NADPH-flavin oxidoreductase [Xylariales sp. PMI_506]
MADLESLIKARYGPSLDGDGIVGPANPTLETLLQHRSVREFLPEKLPTGTLELIVAAAQSAATSSNLQTWSVVAVEDSERKDRAATLSGDQDFIKQAPLFLIFCADLSRLAKVSEKKKSAGEALEYLEMFLMASIDAALAAQNAAVAAESLDLGICYVGAARNHPRELAELLHLPPRVIALFGLAVGKPDPLSPAFVKPRLSHREVLHRETWDEQEQDAHITAYDQTLDAYNAQQGRTAQTWTDRSAQRVASVARLNGRHVWTDVLKERGLNLR